MGCGATQVEPIKLNAEPKPIITLIDADNPPEHPNSIHLTDFSDMTEVTVIIKRKTK